MQREKSLQATKHNVLFVPDNLWATSTVGQVNITARSVSVY